jgi:RHS repeat-associated protein
VSSTQLVQVSNKINDGYRFGYGGHEKDNEVSGEGNTIDFGARIYDSRIGRFKYRDPLAAKFPSESNYIYAGNSPIQLIDVNGQYKYPAKQAAAYTKAYPMLTKYLSNHIKNDVEKSSTLFNGILNFANNKEFGKNELSKDVLTWGDKSIVNISFVNNNVINANAFTLDNKNIYINKDYANAIENILADKDRVYNADEKQQAITAFFITMMDETTLVGTKYSKAPFYTSGGTDGDPGNKLTDNIFYQKAGNDGSNRLYQADKNSLSDTKEIIKTLKDEGKNSVLPTTPVKK